MPILLTLLGAVVLSVVSALGVFTYLGNNQTPEQVKDTIMTEQSDTTQAATLETDMLSVDDVVQFRRRVIKEGLYDSLFFSIPEPVLIDICRVLKGRQAVLNLQNIVDEYLQNGESVYKYISPEPQQESQPQLQPQQPDTTKHDSV